MTTNDKPLTRNYDSDKEKSEIDSDIRVLKLDSDLQRIPAEETASTVCRLTLFCHLLYNVTHYAFMVTRSTFMDHLLNNNLRRSPHFGNDPLKTSK